MILERSSIVYWNNKKPNFVSSSYFFSSNLNIFFIVFFIANQDISGLIEIDLEHIRLKPFTNVKKFFIKTQCIIIRMVRENGGVIGKINEV